MSSVFLHGWSGQDSLNDLKLHVKFEKRKFKLFTNSFSLVHGQNRRNIVSLEGEIEYNIDYFSISIPQCVLSCCLEELYISSYKENVKIQYHVLE